ncbi:aspartate--tRNA ligase [Candidatus Nomurabacteria bacterium]|nr:aspartate--tRNA ligase [Candidatus Nomurabacteria bacterium]
MKDRVYIRDLKDHTGKEVVIAGWVDVRRDQGKMVFFDMRDMTGKVQCVALPSRAEVIEKAKTIRPEWVLKITGNVNKRPLKNVKEGVLNGDVELEVTGIEVLNESETPPFAVNEDTSGVNEELRLKYRYVDLRTDRMQKNIRNRHRVLKFIRDFLSNEGFIEVETPILTKSTPEGSRDFVVPARLYPGKFYALPQSPQQYKQLLMTGGVEKYFQIARCMRDEDTRGDRQPEFTQLDLEMSFVEMEDVMQVNEKLFIELVQKLYPEKKIQQIPFPRIPHKEAMEKYGVDKPDIRKDKNDPNLLAFCWIVDWPFFEKTEEGGWTFTHNPFSRPLPEHLDWLMKKENIEKIYTTQYDIILNGSEVGGGSIRNHNGPALEKVFEIMGHKIENIRKNFGHMMTAFSLGTPPHGGIAWGFDRFFMILQNEINIREVIPFAKTGEGRDPMMDSPSEISDEQLKELKIKLSK